LPLLFLCYVSDRPFSPFINIDGDAATANEIIKIEMQPPHEDVQQELAYETLFYLAYSSLPTTPGASYTSEEQEDM